MNQVTIEVKKILAGFNINYPIIFDFKNSQEFSKYAFAHTDSRQYWNYTMFIYYNPRFILLDFNELVKTGLHEYCHFIHRQKEDFSDEEQQQLFLNINYDHFLESAKHLTKKFVLDCVPQIPSENRGIVKNPRFIEDIFVEMFAEYLIGSQADIFIKEKKHFETAINTHIQIMKEIRHFYHGEL